MTRHLWVVTASGAQVVALASGAVTNLLYARLLPIEVVGRLAVVIALATGLGALADAGLQLLLTREVAAGRIRGERAAGVLLLWLPSLLVGWWLLLAGALTAVPAVRHALGVHPENLVLILEWSLSFLLCQCVSSLAQATGRFNLRSAVLVGNAVATTAFTAGLLAFDASLATAVHASASAYLAAAVGGAIVLTRVAPPAGVPWRSVYGLSRDARPIWVNGLLTFAISGADVILASLALTIAQVGEYQVLKKLAVSLTAPLATLLPLFFARFSGAGAQRRPAMYRRVQTAMALLAGAGIFLLAPCLEPVVRIVFGAQYAANAEIALVITASAFVLQSAGLLGYLLTAAGRVRIPIAMNVGASLVAVSFAGVLLAGRGLSVFAGCLLAANVTCFAIGAIGAARAGIDVIDRTTAESLLLCGVALAAGLVIAVSPPIIGIPLALLGAGVIGWRAIIVYGLGTGASRRGLMDPLG